MLLLLLLLLFLLLLLLLGAENHLLLFVHSMDEHQYSNAFLWITFYEFLVSILPPSSDEKILILFFLTLRTIIICLENSKRYFLCIRKFVRQFSSRRFFLQQSTMDFEMEGIEQDNVVSSSSSSDETVSLSSFRKIFSTIRKLFSFAGWNAVPRYHRGIVSLEIQLFFEKKIYTENKNFASVHRIGRSCAFGKFAFHLPTTDTVIAIVRG